MANHSVAAGELGVRQKTLVADTVDTVTFDRDCDEIEVLIASGTDRIYFTVDGSTPTVAGNNTHEVLGGTALRVPVATSGDTVVKLISSTTPAYSVTGSFGSGLG